MKGNNPAIVFTPYQGIANSVGATAPVKGTENTFEATLPKNLQDYLKSLNITSWPKPVKGQPEAPPQDLQEFLQMAGAKPAEIKTFTDAMPPLPSDAPAKPPAPKSR